MRRDDARPRLITVKQALDELYELVLQSTDIVKGDFHEQWKAIITKHDINYDDTKRWDAV
jgi:hypothetical protein